MSRKVTRVTVDEAAEIAVQGIFAKADRDAAERLKREGKHTAAQTAERSAADRVQALKDRFRYPK